MSETLDLENKIGERVKEQIIELEKILKERILNTVWQACNDYVEYSSYEPLDNWKNKTRADLVGSKYVLHDDSHWGRSMRDKIYEENKEAILPLIQNELIQKLQSEVKNLEDQLQFQVKMNKIHY